MVSKTGNSLLEVDLEQSNAIRKSYSKLDLLSMTSQMILLKSIEEMTFIWSFNWLRPPHSESDILDLNMNLETTQGTIYAFCLFAFSLMT
jgi:hypothetical protein